MQTAEAMEKRRNSIVLAAQQLLAQEELGAFSVRNLAVAAGVSVATIYNLIGDRNAVLVAIIHDLTEQMRGHLKGIHNPTLLSLVETRLNTLIDVCEQQENLLRSAHMAFDELSQLSAWADEPNAIRVEAEAAYTTALHQGLKDGELRGQVSSQYMSRLLFKVYLDATSDWAYRRVSLDQYRNRALSSAFIVLLADATEEFRGQLLSKISQYSGN